MQVNRIRGSSGILIRLILHQLGYPEWCHVEGDLTHSLVMCSYNGGAGHFLLDRLHHVLPHLQPHQVVQLDYDVGQDLQLPLVFLTASVLSQVWECRKQKKPCHLFTIRATLEAGVNILRKSRHAKGADRLLAILETT
jgi:hypothetical protein